MPLVLVAAPIIIIFNEIGMDIPLFPWKTNKFSITRCFGIGNLIKTSVIQMKDPKPGPMCFGLNDVENLWLKRYGTVGQRHQTPADNCIHISVYPVIYAFNPFRFMTRVRRRKRRGIKKKFFLASCFILLKKKKKLKKVKIFSSLFCGGVFVFCQTF